MYAIRSYYVFDIPVQEVKVADEELKTIQSVEHKYKLCDTEQKQKELVEELLKCLYVLPHRTDLRMEKGYFLYQPLGSLRLPPKCYHGSYNFV